ncbi:GntR family transcriptional regulator [Teichococcus vastitatis]|jgi:DNA-binding GntR family transcriptional regulator|uniref:GntR family transcriptional regulator n=1 Tax=Teichococcus vastitatis TaxID=2307076 RepID=A0ABS9W2F9_9PROT|nr:GntR family transcriptional regulator [Pseudoroseomonas vastitatis]MCI0753484.1 GntR family transcriptional regulator [Pseudoroseomonas vastitatis]
MPPRSYLPDPVETEQVAGRKRGSTVDYVVQRVRDALLSGRLALGQRLIEADMTQELGVSRGPWREAMRRLEAEGVVELIPNRGALVRRLSRQDIIDRFRIRQSLEGLAASLAASRMAEPGQGERFRAALQLRDGMTAETAAPRVANFRLHRAIAEGAGNAQLLELITQLWGAELRGPEHATYWQASAAEHDRIIDAVLAGDAAAAEQAMRQHLGAVLDRLLAAPEAESPWSRRGL